jgi:hypothetical protein
MSGLFSSKTKTKSSSTPNAATSALFNPVFQQASAQNARPFTPYTGQLSQGQTADQLAARNMLQPGQGQDTVGQGIGAAQGLLGYQPNQITAPNVTPMSVADPKAYQASTVGQTAQVNAQGYQPMMGQAAQAGPTVQAQAAQIDRSQVQNLNPQMFAGSDLSAYQNPYEDQVVQSALSDLDRQRQMSLNSQAGQFTQAGAFGGSRQGVADSLTNEAYGRTAAQTAAQLRAQGFDTAAGLLNTDINRGFQAQQANQGADLSVLGQNAGFGQQANLTNAGALNQGNQFNTGLLQDMSQANLNYGNQAQQFGASAQNQANAQNASALNQMGQFNAGQQQQANQFGAGVANEFALTNAGYGQQAALANQGAQMQAQQANQSAGLQGNAQQLQAAGLLGNLGSQQQQMGLLDANTLNSYGTQQQETQQQALDRMYQQYLLQQGYGQQQFQNNLGLLGGIGNLYAGASTTGTQTSTPSVGSMIGTAAQVASMFSDVRLKADIEPVGVVDGRNWYRYRYIWDEPGVERLGVMAQEIQKTDPDAVSVDASGFLKVDYGRLN